jgi:phosphoribosylformimino-5-aminoimidazole carboxamide ribotide isomerase
MIVVPAIDLRSGACVQLVGGSYDDERVRRSDPIAVAIEWEGLGFQRVHIVDLDAATGRGTNAPVVRDLVRSTTMSAQVGGGVRSMLEVSRLFDLGVANVVVGTRAIGDARWLSEAATCYPERLIVAADVRGRTVVTDGWSRSAERDVLDVIAELNDLPLAGVLVTAVHREGRMEGSDLELMAGVCFASTLPVLASGGIAGEEDLRALADIGVSQAVVGMALYTGAIDPRAAAEAFAT